LSFFPSFFFFICSLFYILNAVEFDAENFVFLVMSSRSFDAILVTASFALKCKLNDDGMLVTASFALKMDSQLHHTRRAPPMDMIKNGPQHVSTRAWAQRKET
jgi:hypothetical protein